MKQKSTVYGFEVIPKNINDVSTYEGIVYKFADKEERGKWLQKGNIKKIEFPVMYLKTRNKIHTCHPLYKAAKEIGRFPCYLVLKDIDWLQGIAFKGNYCGKRQE